MKYRYEIFTSQNRDEVEKKIEEMCRQGWHVHTFHADGHGEWLVLFESFT